MIIRIVPNTGVQYVELPDLDRAALRGHRERRFRVRTKSDLDAEGRFRASRILDPETRSGWDDADRDEGDDERIWIDRTASLELLLRVVSSGFGDRGAWIPIPFDLGGVWVAMHLRAAEADRIRAHLAIDTTLEGHGSSRGVTESEVGRRELNPVAPRFWRDRAVSRCIESIVRYLAEDEQFRGGLSGEELQLSIAAWADYLKTRFDGDRGLAIELANRPERGQARLVDMVLDLGNSRTCVLLTEDRPGSSSPHQECLELVYPADPSTSYPCPFDTQFAFREHSILWGSDDDDPVFPFISQIVMGPIAGQLLRNSPIDPQSLGMSSPKRYLWDDRDQVPWTWCLADRSDRERREPIRGHVLRRMETSAPLRPSTLGSIPIEPNYPRYAGVIWSVFEMLEQSFRQVNGTRWRGANTNAADCDRRREIGNLVIMYPAGMHSEEIRRYRDACVHACRLWAEFRTDPEGFCRGDQIPTDRRFGIQAPQVQLLCDEGLSIQLCWIYGELVHRHQGNQARFFECLGRPRSSGGDAGGHSSPSLRVASLDIGGGTIDLAIADYAPLETSPASVVVGCHRIFHDGISRAGDEVIRELLEGDVLPELIERCRIAEGRWKQFFLQRGDENDTLLKRQLVRKVWMPIALEYLRLSEVADLANGDASFVVADVPRIDRACVADLEARLGVEGSGILGTSLRVSRDRVRRIIRSSISNTIAQFADIIDQYECDVLIVGGRPSSNPAIREQILWSMAVPPGQIRFLSEARVGSWYPFSRADGTIGDAKTCGVVGGAIAFRAMYGAGIGGFRLHAEPTREPPIVFGIPRSMPEQRLVFDVQQQVLMKDGRCEFPWEPESGVNDGLRIALRRIDSPQAEAQLVYLARLRSAIKRRLSQHPIKQRKLDVVLRSGEDAGLPHRQVEVGRGIVLPLHAETVGDTLRFDVRGSVIVPRGGSDSPEEVPASDAIEFVLKTLAESDGYWLDTGRIVPKPRRAGGGG